MLYMLSPLLGAELVLVKISCWTPAGVLIGFLVTKKEDQGNSCKACREYIKVLSGKMGGTSGYPKQTHSKILYSENRGLHPCLFPLISMSPKALVSTTHTSFMLHPLLVPVFFFFFLFYHSINASGISSHLCPFIYSLGCTVQGI